MRAWLTVISSALLLTACGGGTGNQSQISRNDGN